MSKNHVLIRTLPKYRDAASTRQKPKEKLYAKTVNNYKLSTIFAKDKFTECSGQVVATPHSQMRKQRQIANLNHAQTATKYH